MAIKNKAQKISENNWIVKSNTLNEIRNNYMTNSQQRFFIIYQSKINPNDTNSRKVEIELNDYVRIMQFKQLNKTRIEETARSLLRLTATFKEPDGGFTCCQLFKIFKLYKGTNDKWYVSIDCHDEILPYMFELKKYFFKYKLWNALRLTSGNQVRMYEILKQCEHAGVREISIKDLREFIGISKEEYLRWDNFKARVLDVCQQALSEHTDIKFTYEPIKRGKGGKIISIKFNIKRNNDYIDQLTLGELLEMQPEIEQEEEPNEVQFEPEQVQEMRFENENLEFLAEACNGEFEEKQMDIIKSYLVKLVPFDSKTYQTDQYDYLLSKYKELNYRANRKDLSPIKNRFAYLKSLLELEVKNMGEDDETKW